MQKIVSMQLQICFYTIVNESLVIYTEIFSAVYTHDHTQTFSATQPHTLL